MFYHSPVHIILVNVLSQPHIPRHGELRSHQFPLTALVYNCTQFHIRNSMVVSAYLNQVFLRHELLLLSFSFRFLLMQITTTTKQATAESNEFSTIKDNVQAFHLTIAVVPWVLGMKAWINKEKRHLLDKREHAPNFHWKTPGEVKKNDWNLSPTTMHSLRRQTNEWR